jgi:formamidopyrimidine-DNA glycosylase
VPELPEVEAARRRLDAMLVGQTIVRAKAADDPLIFDRASPSEVEATLTGRRVEGTGRKGKYFWLLLDQPPHPVVHFGMSGRLEIYLRGEPIPKYWKLEIEASNGMVATFKDARRLGRIRLAQDPAGEPPVSRLGFDVLTELPRVAELQRRLKLRRGPIKAVLLDQGFFAGVGNWIADEVLYQARLSPLRSANELDEKEVRRLRTALRSVAEQAVAVEADSEQFPSSWMFHRRWDHRIGTGPRGEALVRQQIGGRTTTWAPSRQK